MVDILSTRLQEVYAKWEPGNPEPASERCTVEDLRRFNREAARRKTLERECAQKVRESSLFRIKERDYSPEAPGPKPSFLHYCCGSCTPKSRDSLVKTVNKRHPPFGLNILVVNPGTTLVSKVFCCISHVAGVKRYYYPRVTQAVLNDERLKEAIKLAAWETATSDGCPEQQALAKAKARAKAILLEMESRISNTLLQITAWILYKLLPCFIQSATVLPSQVDMLKKANETGVPLILLPLHRSHLDYIMISFILLMNNIRNPLIAAGDNLKIPLFGWLLRGLGAFFIKRRIDPASGRKDVLYRAILHTYIMESLRAGHNIEFFVEGGRTRTGKPCMPKGGILSVIIDAYMDGTIEDALLVPVAMNYERLVDGNFVREQLGQPKKMETFTSTIKAIWSTLMGNYGIVKIDFCQPFSLREMLRSFQAQQSKLAARPKAPTPEKTLKYTMSSSSLYGTDIVVEEHRQLVDGIARHVVYDSSKSTPIMSTNVVAFLLLNKFRDGCTLDNLVEAFDAMKTELEMKNKNVAFYGESIDIVNHALDILGPGLVKEQRQEVTEAVDDQPVKSSFVVAIRPVSILPNVIELSYYSNTMLLHYVMDSVIVTALYAELQSRVHDPTATAPKNITVYRESLVERALTLCDILKYEFIFCKPCQQLEHVILETIQGLCHMDMLTLKEDVLDTNGWAGLSRRHLIDELLGDDFADAHRPPRPMLYKLNLRPKQAKKMEFLHTLLRPLVDTYTFSAFTLRKLVGRSLSERDLVHEILSEIKTNLDRGTVSYGESLCVDPIKNSLKLFERWDVLKCHLQENIKIFYLKDECDTDTAAIDIYETVAAFKWTRNVD